MRTYCEGEHCSRRDECALHQTIINEEMEYIDFSTYGSGSANANGLATIDHWCGDAGDFKLFKLRSPFENNEKSSSFPKIKIMKASPMQYTLLKCANCESHGIDIILNDENQLIAKCGWCNAESILKMPDKLIELLENK